MSLLRCFGSGMRELIVVGMQSIRYVPGHHRRYRTGGREGNEG